jgi:hypothetical protein
MRIKVREKQNVIFNISTKEKSNITTFLNLEMIAIHYHFQLKYCKNYNYLYYLFEYDVLTDLDLIGCENFRMNLKRHKQVVDFCKNIVNIKEFCFHNEKEYLAVAFKHEKDFLNFSTFYKLCG